MGQIVTLDKSAKTDRSIMALSDYHFETQLRFSVAANWAVHDVGFSIINIVDIPIADMFEPGR